MCLLFLFLLLVCYCDFGVIWSFVCSRSRGKPSFEEKRLSDRLKGQCTTFDKLLKEARGKLELVMSSEGFIDGAEGAGK